MKYDKLIERLQKLIGFTPKQAELCKILDYTSSKFQQEHNEIATFPMKKLKK